MQKRILVVAHAADIVESIPITLELAGHKVELADCGLDAILWAERMKPDLILVDGKLPDMDGSIIVRILRRLPATANLATVLLKARDFRASTQSPAGPAEDRVVNSTELLQEAAFALALCRAAGPQAAPPEHEAFHALRVAMAGEAGFTSQTESTDEVNVARN